MNPDLPFKVLPAAGRIPACFTAVILLLMITAFNFGQEIEDNSGEAVALFNEAQDVHEKGDLAAAIKLYEKALSIIPKFPEAEFQLGTAFLSLGRIDEAEKSFRRVVAYKDDWTLALTTLGSVLVTKAKYAEAEQFLSKAITLDELNFPAYTALTELRLKTKSSPAVLTDLLNKLKTQSGKANPTAAIWAARSALEIALGDNKSAKLSAAKALEIDPRNQFALTSRALAALDESDLTAAEDAIGRLEAAAPNSQDFKILRARVLYINGNDNEALKLLNSVENPSADLITFRDKIIVNNSSSAAELEKQLEKEGKNPAVLGRLCSVLRIENPAKALNFCRRASEAEPANLNHAVGFGSALVQAKQYAEAVSLFRRILTIAPDNSTVHANLAIALFQLENYAAAKIEYQWLVEKQPNLPIAYYFLGIIHDHLKEYVDAMAHYQQFLRIADAEKSKLEIEKVNLRLPGLEKQIRDKKGKRNGK